MGVTCSTNEDGSHHHHHHHPIRTDDAQLTRGQHHRRDEHNAVLVGNEFVSTIQSDFKSSDVVMSGGGAGATTMRPPPPAQSATPAPSPPPRAQEISEPSHDQVSPLQEPLPQFDPLAAMTAVVAAAMIASEVTAAAPELTDQSNAGSTSISRSMRRTGSIATSIAIDPPLFSYISNIGAFSTSTYADSSGGKHSTTIGLADSAIQRHMNAILNPHASVSSGAAPSIAAAGFATAGIQRIASDAVGEASGAKNSHAVLTDEWKSTERDVFDDAE